MLCSLYFCATLLYSTHCILDCKLLKINFVSGFSELVKVAFWEALIFIKTQYYASTSFLPFRESLKLDKDLGRQNA